MRKLILSVAGATALATASIANAAITVTGSTNVATPIVPVNGATQSTIDFGKNPEPSGGFTGSVDFSNTVAGLYSIIVGTSTPGAIITDVALTGISGTVGSYSVTGGTGSSLSLVVPFADAGNYSVSFAGTAPAGGGVATGNLTFQVAAVPEPGTWALMLLGFAGVGLAVRRRRPLALAQVA